MISLVCYNRFNLFYCEADMGRLLDILKNTTINVTEAEFATVGDFWKDQVFYYKRDRLYYVTNGGADIILKEKPVLVVKPKNRGRSRRV